MKSFRLEKEPAPTTCVGRACSAVRWAFLGVVIGFFAYQPLGVLMVGSTKAMIGYFEDWTWSAFVTLTAIASATIPLARIPLDASADVDGHCRMSPVSVVVALIASVVSSILAIATFNAVQASWQYLHDGVADWFILSIPATTGIAVAVSAFLQRHDTSVRRVEVNQQDKSPG